METIINLLPLDAAGQTTFAEMAPNEKQYFIPVEAPVKAADIPLELRREATVILGNPKPELLAECPNLKWLQLWSAGSDQYVKPGVLPTNAILTCASGAYGQSVSEHILASLLALMKRLPAYRDNQQATIWMDEGKAKSPVDSLVLVLGTGDIGSHFAQRVKALGGKTIGFNRHPDRAIAGFDEIHSIAELDSWLPKADVVVAILPSTPETIHMFNAERLALLKNDAILINAGRGNLIDCVALANVLSAGKLWGAALDVTEPEPLPVNHSLWKCKNLLLTPHVAGGDHLEQTVKNIIEIARTNLKAFLSGEPLKSRVI